MGIRHPVNQAVQSRQKGPMSPYIVLIMQHRIVYPPATWEMKGTTDFNQPVASLLWPLAIALTFTGKRKTVSMHLTLLLRVVQHDLLIDISYLCLGMIFLCCVVPATCINKRYMENIHYGTLPYYFVCTIRMHIFYRHSCM